MLYHGTRPFPELGVMGASVATTIGRGTGALYVLSRLFRGNGRVKLSLSHLKVNTNVMATLVKLSSSGMFQVFIGMASWIGLMRILSSYGSTAIADTRSASESSCSRSFLLWNEQCGRDHGRAAPRRWKT